VHNRATTVGNFAKQRTPPIARRRKRKRRKRERRRRRRRKRRSATRASAGAAIASLRVTADIWQETAVVAAACFDVCHAFSLSFRPSPNSGHW